ncbi:GRAM domain-containing protein [Shewanella olleyana]|uniref:GRAM domain-containing protein n=1 Tax=Shewanella olleyana TaxID=135626 RepID=UPI00200DF0A2|nr:GRAM domain-containing protein [Shewanella olleyana]MCL1066743.1 GRAM domain-containing protein [Shewanella olleyana]
MSAIDFGHETIIKSSFATAQNGAFSGDGKLSLTESRLCFEASNKIFEMGPYEIALNKIEKVEKCWGTGGGILPVTADAIKIELNNHKSYKFMVADSEAWIELLTA